MTTPKCQNRRDIAYEHHSGWFISHAECRANMWMLFALVAAVFWSAADACGTAGDICCEGDFCEDIDVACEAGTCVIARPGEGVCIGKGTLGQPCCMRACAGSNITCAEGTCVDVNDEPVIDQSGPLPGALGGPCIGDDHLCDENDILTLECVGNVCVEPSIVSDQSVCFNAALSFVCACFCAQFLDMTQAHNGTGNNNVWSTGTGVLLRTGHGSLCSRSM